MNDRVTIYRVTGETRSGTGVEKTYEATLTRGYVKNVSSSSATIYSTQGYSGVDAELVIRERAELPSDSIDFAGYVAVTDSMTGQLVTYDIRTPPVRRGAFVTVGLKRR